MHAPCRACGSATADLLDLGLQPIVNELQATPDAAVSVYSMLVGGCLGCGLVQMLTPVPPEVFYTDYATPSSWKREPHLERLVAVLEGALSQQATVIDVGCNDGKFLIVLRERGWHNLAGVEPTENTARMARAHGLDVRHAYLDPAVAESLVAERGQWDCVILRQVLEHVCDLEPFGASLNRLLKVGGLIAIEVPDLRVNVDHSDYTLWEEHVNYFSEQTLTRYLCRHGFRVRTAYRSLFSGITLTVVAEKVTGGDGAPSRTSESAVTHEEIAAYQRWAAEFPQFRSRVRNVVAAHADSGAVALFGVGSRSSLFCNLMGIADLVSVAFDDQPAKQGVYLPRSGIPVRPGKELPDQALPSLVLLGVNAENEDAVLAAHPALNITATYSILPPSPRLLPAWPEPPAFPAGGC
ncbi:MAG: methyltransferase domain-containing protein [Actinomycetales bacterium]|nr:methyltransferase domain-containing protein [Actinomycetales bacterium]